MVQCEGIVSLAMPCFLWGNFLFEVFISSLSLHIIITFTSLVVIVTFYVFVENIYNFVKESFHWNLCHGLFFIISKSNILHYMNHSFLKKTFFFSKILSTLLYFAQQ